MQAPGRRLGQHHAEQLDGGEVGVGGRRRVVAQGGRGRAAAAADRHAALAVLHRVDGVETRPRLARLGQRAEGLLDPGQGLCRLELAGDDECGVVGLVVQLVEGLEALDVDVFHVGARADGALAVVVPLEHGGPQAFPGDGAGVVLAHLHLVAHHAELGGQVLARDVGVDHRVGLPAQVPLQGVGVGAEAGEVIGAVEPGGAVGVQPALAELAPGRRVLGRALEEQVLEQVRHAGLAVVLVLGADAVGDVDRGAGLAGVGRQQHLQAVGQPVLVDAFDAAQRLQRFHRRLRAGRAGQGQEEGEQEGVSHAHRLAARAGRAIGHGRRGRHGPAPLLLPKDGRGGGPLLRSRPCCRHRFREDLASWRRSATNASRRFPRPPCLRGQAGWQATLVFLVKPCAPSGSKTTR